MANPASTEPRRGPVLSCHDCADPFHWTESPSLERCRACAAIRAVFLGVPEEEA